LTAYRVRRGPDGIASAAWALPAFIAPASKPKITEKHLACVGFIGMSWKRGPPRF
jgi:hypothetical protein